MVFHGSRPDMNKIWQQDLDGDRLAGAGEIGRALGRAVGRALGVEDGALGEPATGAVA